MRLEYKFNNTFRFSINGKKFAFDYVNLLLSEIDDITDDILSMTEKNRDLQELTCKYSEDDIRQAVLSLSELADNGYFLANSRTRFEDNRKYEKGFLSLPPVHNCNMRCSYCFAKSGDVYKGPVRGFNYEIIEKALEFVYFDFMKDCSQYRIDFVSGGEPLLNFDIVKYVRDIGNSLYKETGKPLQMWMCTNATLLNDDILKYLSDNGIGLGISIDGDKKTHDAIRVTKSGEGTYDTVAGWIKQIIQSNSYSRALKEIWGQVVITNKTESLIDIVKHHKQLGLKSIQMKIVRSEKDKEFSINKDNIHRIKKMYHDFIDFLKVEISEHRIDYLQMILNDNDFIGKIIRRLILREGVVYRCQAGRNKISIAANGDIYPCDSFVGNDEFIMGNVNKGINSDVRERFYKLITHDREDCCSCWARYLCGGDCYSNSYIVNGRIEKPDDVICDMTRYAIILSLDLLNHINDTAIKEGQYLYAYLNAKKKLDK